MASAEQVLKVVVLGEAGVGKTALVDRFVNNFFTDCYQTTMSLDIHKKQVTVDGRQVTLQIWDTAGCERFHSLSVGFYRGSMCCVLVFDVSDANSFSMLETWRDNFLLVVAARQPENFPFVVVGNKIDIPDRVVSTKRAEQWCSAHGDLPYFETSARDSTNVDQAFQAVAHRAMLQFGPPPRQMTKSIRLKQRRPSSATDGVGGETTADDERRGPCASLSCQR